MASFQYKVSNLPYYLENKVSPFNYLSHSVPVGDYVVVSLYLCNTNIKPRHKQCLGIVKSRIHDEHNVINHIVELEPKDIVELLYTIDAFEKDFGKDIAYE